MLTFPLVDREKSGDLVLEAALGTMRALFDHITEVLGGDDRQSRHWFTYCVGKAIMELSDEPRRGQPHTECNLISTRVVEFVKARARQERDEERAAAERERRARVVVQFSDRINSAFGKRSAAAASTASSRSGGDQGPGPRAA